MKKRILLIFVLTCFIIFVPAFVVKVDNRPEPKLDRTSSNVSSEDTNYSNFESDISVFSSNTCYKKTYYINKDRVYVYDNCTCNKKSLFYLNKGDVVVAYKELDGYIYCEANNGMKGWIEKNDQNLCSSSDITSSYTIDVSINDQKLSVYKGNKKLIECLCSTGKIGNPDTETPLGVFKVQERNNFFYNLKYNEGGKYYLKFFSNYLIHSIPVDKNGNIIKGENGKLGLPESHGCIRVSLEDAEWIYKNIPNGSKVYIHY